MVATYSLEQPVMFQHCDPAQIVFYPRYFEMVNATIETWFDRVADYSYLTMFNQAHSGVPTAAIEARFHNPSRLGDILLWTLQVTKLGKSSISFAIEAHCGAEKRMSASTTLVHIDGAKGKSAPWPDLARVNISNFMEKE
ncbi:acyl-CoA thioesterase [Maritalea porphyrae]|jgi:4-hydroxybenzoyl-CoA thioesterase|uniref:acyl-CoA thioesterase n=1 Tax=Maritalea porphyrae TaxID=880732 RepID=UPI0022AFD92A|nr:thioesterase family protein [Maritalea porphyrae]MCZ4273260.1 thioesterase family protein [Maritalea porphyrae]